MDPMGLGCKTLDILGFLAVNLHSVAGATSAICAAMRAMLFRPTPLTPTNKALPHAAIEDP